MFNGTLYQWLHRIVFTLIQAFFGKTCKEVSYHAATHCQCQYFIFYIFLLKFNYFLLVLLLAVIRGDKDQD